MNQTLMGLRMKTKNVWVLTEQLRSLQERQLTNELPESFALAFLIGGALVLMQIIVLISSPSFAIESSQRTLKNHSKCGITTGGMVNSQ